MEDNTNNGCMVQPTDGTNANGSDNNVMEEETNNGSPAQPANGTVTNNPNNSNNSTTPAAAYHGTIYTKAASDVVEYVLGRRIATSANGDLSGYTLEELSEFVQRKMVQLVKKANIPANMGGRGLNWPVPKNISGVQGALIVLQKETIRLVCTEESMNKSIASGVLAVYQEEGRFKGTYCEIGDNLIDEWADALAGAVDKKWKAEFRCKLHDSAKRVCECTNENYIYFKNCILNYDTKERMLYTPDIVTLRKSPIELPGTLPPVPVHTKPDGTQITFWDWLNSLAPYDGGVELLIKLVGAVLRNNHNWRVMVTLFNKTGRNGKSTFLRMLKACVGYENVMTSTISDLCDKVFGLSKLPGCTLITCEDSDSGAYVRNTSRIKCIISHDTVSVERKNKDEFDYTPNVMVVCAANDLPRTKDKGLAWTDRNRYVPFTGQFTGKDDDKTISSEWVVSEEFCEYMVYQALVVMENYYELPEPEEALILKREFISDNDPVVDFFNYMDEEWKYDFIPNFYAWERYKEWLHETRPNTNLPTQKSFIVHFTDVATANGGWTYPKEASGKSRRFKVDVWCVHANPYYRPEDPDWCKQTSARPLIPHFFNTNTKFSSGIIRTKMWDYCQANNVTPIGLGDEYVNVRKKLGLED